MLSEDEGYADKLRAASPSEVVAISVRNEGADYYGSRRQGAERDAIVKEKASGDELTFRMAVPGEHNLRNALFAIAVARRHGMNWEQIRQGIETYSSLPMRWASETVKGVTIINDAYNANPMSMRAALDTFAGAPVEGRRWLVLADMLELGETEKEEHNRLGAYAARGQWAGLIVVGDRGAWIADGAGTNGFGKGRIIRCRTNAEAAQNLAALVAPGDAVLLKGSRGMRLEEVRDQYVLLPV